MIEIVGYLASFFVLISFFTTNMRKLRWINLLGCSLFIIYGIYIESIPVLITNVSIVLVNIWYLSKKEKGKSIESQD